MTNKGLRNDKQQGAGIKRQKQIPFGNDKPT